MMNLPKLRGAKFLEDQSIRSAKYELTSELKKMPKFSVLLLLTWCQQHCQIKSKTRYISFFLFVMVGFFGVCLWVNVIFDHLFVGKWGFLQRDIVERTSTQSSTTQCHSLQQRWYHPRVPPAQRTEMQVSWFVKWFAAAVFSVFIKIRKVSFGKMNHSTFLCGERALQQLNYMSSISKALLLHCIHLIANYISLQPPFLAIWSLPKKLFD